MARKKNTSISSNFDEKWLEMTLEALEKNTWPSPEGESHLETTCFALRKKPLKLFGVEDFRIMIGQSIGLTYLVPLALNILEENILAEGDFYEGDLLNALLTSDTDFWETHKNYWERGCSIYTQNLDKLRQADTIKTIRNEWKSNFAIFEKIHAIGK